MASGKIFGSLALIVQADVHQHGQVCKGELALLVAALRRDGILPCDLTFVCTEDQNADNCVPQEDSPCWVLHEILFIYSSLIGI